MGRATGIPPEAYAAAAAYLADTLDWLNLWHGNEASGELDGDHNHTESPSIAPHL